MRTRCASYNDYGITDGECKDLLELCRNADSKKELLLLQATQESNDIFASILFYSLRNDVSFQRMEMAMGKQPIEPIDFYAYRRKALYLFKEKLMENEKIIIEKWQNDGCMRRYISVDAAVKELQISNDKLNEIAKKANAIMRIGQLVRINMIALYRYMDKEYTAE